MDLQNSSEAHVSGWDRVDHGDEAFKRMIERLDRSFYRFVWVALFWFVLVVALLTIFTFFV